MGNDIIPGMKHRGCGGAVYLDGEKGFFCKRCDRKLSVPMHKVPRGMLRGTKFETPNATASAIGPLIEAVAIAVEFIVTLLAV